MKVYLVGGAVRDKLLGYPFHEKDWVVVGSAPAEMEAQGYTAVGKDFPVFLHPNTKEEYALARTERKTGKGYTGFSFYCGKEVSLEDDLIRRDLTINAMAEDEHGQIYDPFGGKRDLEDRILRHVSSAFAEDPVRILRIARFAARYHSLGFRVAQETIALMQSMVDAGEADHLVAERVWKELQRALGEKNPEVFIETLRACGALARVLPEIDQLFGVPQTAIHHPEIDTGIHCLMSLQQACALSNEVKVRFATLLHDLGKGTTPQEEWPRHIAHEERSIPLVNDLCDRIAAPREYKDLALLVAKWHTHCHRALELRPDTLAEFFTRIDVLRKPERFREFLLCCEADARGRTGFENRDYPQASYLLRAAQAFSSITTASITNNANNIPLSGKAIGEELAKQRKYALKQFKDEYIPSEI